MSGKPKLPYLAGEKIPSPLAMIDEDLIAAIPPNVLYRCTTVRALATRSDLCKLLKKSPSECFSLKDKELVQFQTDHGIETQNSMGRTLTDLADLGLVSIIEVRIRSSMKLVDVKYKWRASKDEPQYLTKYLEV